jgi:hypothetical protein
MLNSYSSNRINPKTGEHFAGDYTGFASGELKRYFARNRSADLGIEKIATRIGISSGDLRRLVISPDTEFVGLGMTDRIFLKGLGIDICYPVNAGELTVIPNAHRKHAMWMAEDEFWAQERKPTQVGLMVRAGELIQLRRSVLDKWR